MNIGNGRRKRKIFGSENKTIIDERLNGSIIIGNIHRKSIVNEVMFNTKIGSSSNKNNFDVIVKKRLIGNAGIAKCGLNGLMFACGNMRFVDKDKNIAKSFNFMDERLELISMENIIPKLNREALFSLLCPFSRRMTSNDENILERERKRWRFKKIFDSGEHGPSFAGLSGCDSKNGVNRSINKSFSNAFAKIMLIVK